MKIGVFVPIGNNGWLISTHAPQYMPTFELIRLSCKKPNTTASISRYR